MRGVSQLPGDGKRCSRGPARAVAMARAMPHRISIKDHPPVGLALAANKVGKQYHAVRNYYLKYSWEYFMQNTCITYSFIVDNPNILGNFICCWLGRPNWERIT